MARIPPVNSTNVRIKDDLVPAAVALAMWAALVGTLRGSGALDRLHDELSMLALFACLLAALAYVVDAELRRAVQRQSTFRLGVRFLAVLAASSLHVALSLALAPAAVVLAAACIARAFEPRFRSAVAASPGARPGAP